MASRSVRACWHLSLCLVRRFPQTQEDVNIFCSELKGTVEEGEEAYAKNAHEIMCATVRVLIVPNSHT